MSLLDALRSTADEIADAAVPAGAEILPIVGALIAHLDAKNPELAQVDPARLPLKEPEPAAEGSGPVVTAAPVAAGPSKEELEAQVAALQSQTNPPGVVPTVNVSGQDVPVQQDSTK